jgi:hypothetical protein
MPAINRKDLLAAEKVFRAALVRDDSDELPDYIARRAQAVGAARRAGITKIYSLNNQMSLVAQVRMNGLSHLGVYAGPKHYEEIGRTVKDGTKPLVVCAPVVKKDDVSGEDKLAGWFNVEVFDYTDTLSNDPDFVEPDFETPMFSGNRTTLRSLAELSTVPVSFRDDGAALERSSFDGEEVLVDSSAPIGNQISTLVHQLCHQALGDACHPATKEHEELAVLGQFLFMEIAGLGSDAGNDVATQALDSLKKWVDPKTGGAIDGHKARMRLLNKRLKEGLTLASGLFDCIAPANVVAPATTEDVAVRA